MMKPAVAAGTAAILLTACQTTPIKHEAAAVQLDPMPAVARAADYRLDGIRDGKPHSYGVVSAEDGSYTYANPTGCSWTTAADDFFQPATSWAGCAPFDDGTAEVARSGDVYPLQVGHSWKYDVRGFSGGNSWSSTRTCKVEDTARIETISGTHDTYRVVCKQGATTRTYFMSPALGDYVRFVRDRGYKGKTVTERG